MRREHAQPPHKPMYDKTQLLCFNLSEQTGASGSQVPGVAPFLPTLVKRGSLAFMARGV